MRLKVAAVLAAVMAVADARAGDGSTTTDRYPVRVISLMSGGDFYIEGRDQVKSVDGRQYHRTPADLVHTTERPGSRPLVLTFDGERVAYPEFVRRYVALPEFSCCTVKVDTYHTPGFSYDQVVAVRLVAKRPRAERPDVP